MRHLTDYGRGRELMRHETQEEDGGNVGYTWRPFPYIEFGIGWGDEGPWCQPAIGGGRICSVPIPAKGRIFYLIIGKAATGPRGPV